MCYLIRKLQGFRKLRISRLRGQHPDHAWRFKGGIAVVCSSLSEGLEIIEKLGSRP